MKASELRIGNFVNQIGFSVQDGYPPNYKKLDQIKEAKQIDFSVYMEPIPLTEEWLLKFGLKETKDQDVLRVNYVNYHKGTDTFNYCIAYYFDDQGYVDNIFKEIKHVHQLQNLYFALTGEELTL